MTNTAWKAISPTEACDILSFWVTAPWPMNMDQTINYAREIGWTAVEDEDETYLVNGTAGLTIPDIDTPDMPSGDIASVTFYLTDVTRGDITPEATSFLNEHFDLYQSEATTRWGDGMRVELDADGRTVEWGLGADKGRIALIRGKRSISASFVSPQYAKVLRELGE